MAIVRMRSRSPDGTYELQGLTLDELNAIDAMLAGQTWVTVDDEGRLRQSPARKPLPQPDDDATLQPYWTRLDPPPKNLREATLDPRFLEEWHSPSLMIQHLCGYSWSPDGYAYQARTLRNMGFDCLRSQRGHDGRFKELWYLPGLWMAGGELKRAIDPKQGWQKQLSTCLDFLCHNASFGTLDVLVQRAAMVIE